MRIRTIKPDREKGQSLLETALLMPLVLLLVLNVINFGYFYVVALNLAASPRSGVLYSIMGFSTPQSLAYPKAGPPSTANTISHLSQQDLTGAINNPTGASLQVCSIVLGLSGTGANTKSKSDSRPGPLASCSSR